MKRRISLRRKLRGEVVDFDGELGFDSLQMEQMLSVAKSQRRSVNIEKIKSVEGAWIGGRASKETTRTGRVKVTGFRMRGSQDIERGL